MATIDCSPEALEAASKCYCFPRPMTEQIKIYLLAVLTGLDNLRPEDLAARAKCYCFDPKTQKAIENYLLCQAASNVVTCGMVTGTGDPTGVVTPEFEGQLYHDTDGDTWWYSTGTTSADWTQIPTGGGPCANKEGAGDPT